MQLRCWNKFHCVYLMLLCQCQCLTEKNTFENGKKKMMMTLVALDCLWIPGILKILIDKQGQSNTLEKVIEFIFWLSTILFKACQNKLRSSIAGWAIWERECVRSQCQLKDRCILYLYKHRETLSHFTSGFLASDQVSLCCEAQAFFHAHTHTHVFIPSLIFTRLATVSLKLS